MGLGLGLKTRGLGLVTYGLGLGLDDFRIRVLGLGLGERGLGLATMGLDYISEYFSRLCVYFLVNANVIHFNGIAPQSSSILLILKSHFTSSITSL